MKSNTNSRYKKGSLIDLMFLAVVIFAIAITTIIASKIYGSFHEQTQNQFSSEANNIYEQSGSIIHNGMDNIIFFLLVGMSIAIIITAFQINTHPAMFFISLFILVIILVIAANLSNAYNEISSDSQLINETQYLPKTTYILNHLPIFILGFATLITIVMFGVRT